MSFRFPQPSNEDDFELLCLRFLREIWRCPTLQKYGKRGERQDGIDLIDEGGGAPLRAVQCKHHEPEKTIPPAEIEGEVAKALGSGLPLDEYYILTTARKTAQSQKTVIRINCEHTAAGKFKVTLWTWADIEERLSELDDATQDKVLRGDSGRSGPAIHRLISNVISEHLDRPLYSSGSILDEQLESIGAAIDRHEPEVAEAKLNELEARAADKLQPSHLYQVKVLRSRLFLRRLQWEQAGRALLDAKRHMPGTERARINEALGYELLGDGDKAHALATALRNEFSQSVKLLTIWVRTAPATATLTSLIATVGSFAEDDEELNLALAHRAFLEDRFDDASRFARRATELDPESPQAWFVLGQAKHLAGFKAACGARSTLLRDAEQHYDRAVQLAHGQKLAGLEAAVRFNRGKVRHLLGDKRAEADYLAAVELARPDQDLRTEYAGFLVELERYDEAVRELAAEFGEPGGARPFYEAAARYGRNVGDDRKQAEDLLRKVISDESAERWSDAHILLVQWAVDNGTQTDARSIIAGTKLREVNPLVYFTLCGWLASSEGNAEVAKDQFRNAVKQVTDAASREHLFLLGQALVSVGEDELAMPLLERCYRPGVFNVECRTLLGCARRLQRHDVSSRVCRELREAGETDARIIQTEIGVLQMYDPHEALRVAQEYLGTHPSDRYVVLWQSALALRLDRPELIVSDLSRLPAADDITVEGCSLVLGVLCAAGQHVAALRFAYDALRAHFDDEAAHAQYVFLFLKVSPDCPDLRVEGQAGPGMAVCYWEEHDGREHWIVIEDADEPDLSREEYSPDHALSRALTGQSCGESVVVSDLGIQARTVTLRRVLHKFVYRFLDCRDHYQIRFPGGSAIQMIRVGSGDQFDPSPIIKSLEERKKHIERLDEHYRTHPMPFARYVELAGRDEFATWAHLVSDIKLGIRCFTGDTNELRAAIALARGCKTVVLDITALIAISQLDLLRLLPASSRRFVVAQTTFERLQSLVTRAEDAEQSDGAVAVMQGRQLVLSEATAEQRGQYSAFLKTIRDAVRGDCQIQPCPQAAELAPKHRETVVEVIGRHSLDSMLLAKAPDTVLWTDDLILDIVGKTDFQTGRVWTQPMLFVFQQEGEITQTEFDQATAKLVGWNYQGIVFDGETLIAAADIAGWRMDHWPVPSVMRWLHTPTRDPRQGLRVAAKAIRLAWEKDVPNLIRQEFLFATLAGLKSERLILELFRRIPKMFSVNLLSADEVQDCIAMWMRRPTTLLLP